MPIESTPTPDVSVVIPSHNPDKGRLSQTLMGLRRQTLPNANWEALLIDNASSEFPDAGQLAESAPSNLRVTHEPRLGLTSARMAGFRSAAGSLIVLVDDDNVLAPDYLAQVVDIFGRRPHLGAAGGKSRPVFETAPDAWVAEFFPLLAIRDLGESEIVATTPGPAGSGIKQYPECAPIGAGMALRREAALRWVARTETDPQRLRLDRTGSELVSGGDNDIIMTLLEQGLAVGYFPSLSLDHLIPAKRLSPAYLARLNRAIQRSWIGVLALHGANRWPRIGPWTVIPRQARAYFKLRAWRSHASYIRWQGACGQFEGRAAI